jgi:hypothetical protein
MPLHICSRLARAALLAIIGLQLAACSSLYDRAREDEWGPRALLNPAQIVPKSPRAAATVANTWSTSGDRPSEFDQFYAIERKLNDPADKDDKEKLLRRYVEQGIVLSNNVCDTWFNLLERAQANTQFWKNNSVITAATATTIMGAADAAAREIAIVAAGFAGINAGFENFQSTFLFSPNMQTVRKRIAESREQAVSAKFRSTSNPITSYEVAKAELLKYHQLCSGSEIKNLIQSAVDIAGYEFDATTWTTKIQQAGRIAPTPTRSIENSLSEVLLARATARKSFDALKADTNAALATAIQAFSTAHDTLSTGWDVIQAGGNRPSITSETEVTKISAAIIALNEPVEAVKALAKAAPDDKPLQEAWQLLEKAHGDMIAVGNKLTGLKKAYIAAQ